MKKRVEHLDITKLVFNAATFSLCGWFIFVLIEIIVRVIKGPSPWPFMILFTLLLYSGVGIAVGSVLGGVIGFLLRMVKRWQQSIEAIPLIMSCCITLIMFLYMSLFIHDQFLPLYPHLPPILFNLALITFSPLLLCSLYMFFAKIVDKTRLMSSYLALSIALYAFLIVGLYINKNLLSGKLFSLDPVRVTTTIGILISSAILYLITYSIFVVIGKRVGNILKSVFPKTLIVIVILLLAIGGTTLYVKTHSPLEQPMIKPSSRTEDKPNIILISMDTTRADHLSCYGYHRNTTPHLDKLARESVVFKNAYAPSPWTLPSHASIFTGMYPTRHGAHCDWEIMKSNWPFGLGRQHKSLAEILLEHSYMTAGIVSVPLCKKSFGVAQGFEYYDDALIYVGSDIAHFTLFKILSRWVPLKDIADRKGLNGCRVASQINNLVFAWLEKHYQYQFFLFIHYFDPHTPYLPPDEYFLLFRDDETGGMTVSERHKRDLLARYDGEIAYLDYHLGELFEKLKELKLYDTSMIIITSDHGEFFGEHDFWGHGHELYEEVLKVPLIIKYPSSYSRKGVQLNRVSLVDIMPTILDFLVLPLPENLQGRNLFEDNSRVMAEIYLHKYKTHRKKNEFARELKALYFGNYKYVKEYVDESKRHDELYDIDNDPREVSNLVDTMPDKAKEMERKLMEWLPQKKSRAPTDKPLMFDQATKESLKALGYIQ